MPKLTANGGNNPSAMHNGMTWKRRMRIQKAATLTAMGILKDSDIAAHIGITQAAFSVLKTTKEFKSAMIELNTGIISQNTQLVARSEEYQREEIADMIPLALQNLRNAALSKNPQIALKASLEILDRDGKHAKVSRTSVTLEQHVDISNVTSIGNNIMNILKGSAPESLPQNKIIDATQPMAEAVVEDVLAEFTRSASDADKQVNSMADVITEETLEFIEAVTKSVQ